MRTAAAQISIQGLPNLRIIWMRGFPKQRRRGNDHPVEAVAALGGLFINKGALKRVKFAVLDQSFQGRDARRSDLRYRQLAGLLRLVAEQYHTGSAFLPAAAEMRTHQPQLIPKNVKERRIRPGLDGMGLSIHHEDNFV